MNLFICRSLFVSLVVYTSMVFSTFDPIMAQENAYPLQMSGVRRVTVQQFLE